MTLTVLPEIAFAFMLIFARVGTLIMLVPALGEATIPARVRLAFALSFSLLLYPLVADSYPPVPPGLPAVLALFGGEILVGFLIGLAARLIAAALQVAGSAIAFQMGLGFAQGVDPTQGTQGALFASFLSVLGVTLIFAADLHHLFIAAIHDSYRLFAPGAGIPVADFSALSVATFARTFQVGVQVAAPFVAFGLVFYLGLGILSRLMPQIQIFFVALPANIMLGFVMLLVLLGAVMAWYLDHVAVSIAPFIAQ